MIRISRENIYFLPFLIFFFLFTLVFYSARCDWSSVVALRTCDISWSLVDRLSNIKYVKHVCTEKVTDSSAHPSALVLGGSRDSNTSHIILDLRFRVKLSGLFSLSLFTSQNGCELWMAVVFHLVSPFDLFSLATRDFSCCAVRDLFAFRSML